MKIIKMNQGIYNIVLKNNEEIKKSIRNFTWNIKKWSRNKNELKKN